MITPEELYSLILTARAAGKSDVYVGVPCEKFERRFLPGDKFELAPGLFGQVVGFKNDHAGRPSAMFALNVDDLESAMVFALRGERPRDIFSPK